MTNKFILLIGGIPYQNRSETIGGTTILMKNLIDYCNDNHIPYRHLSTNRFYGKYSGIKNYVGYLYLSLKNIGQSHSVVVNVSSYKGSIFVYFPIFLLCKLFHRKVYFRMFGGTFQNYFNSSKLVSAIVSFELRHSSGCIFETKQLVSFFSDLGFNPFWLPNVRKPVLCDSHKTYSKRFVFISQVKESKGIDIILQASKTLDEDFIIDIYGPILDSKYSLEYFKDYNVNYRGVLSPDEVIKTLHSYDVLLLPTFWKGEGYPGIIIEAMSIGIPSISTKWSAIPEIVVDKFNGLLIQPHSSDELADAMRYLNFENYLSFSENARHFYNENLNSDIINEKLINFISK